ncbi:MAG: ATP-binding cassette domain-containing protein, partial [Acidimicrobiia bacterium]
MARRPGVPKPDPVVVASEVRRSFGGLVAVDVAHLEVQRGAITALIGPNGAGKTTLFNILTGFDQGATGRWSLRRDGCAVPLAGVPAHRVARLGMVRTFQLTRSLGRLRVVDNVKLGATGQVGESLLGSLRRRRWRRQDQDVERRADELLARFRLDHMRDELAGELSGGQHIGRA